MIPDLSVIWVIAFVLVLAAVLDRLLLRPVTRVMEARKETIQSARELAETSRKRAEAAAAELDARTRAARAEVYRRMDEMRRAALESRADIVSHTRAEVERSVADATARIRSQADAARRQLEGEADALAAAVVERVLGRKAS